MDSFCSKGMCRGFAILEMLLAGIYLAISCAHFLYSSTAKYDDEDTTIIYNKPILQYSLTDDWTINLARYVLIALSFVHILLYILVLWVGQKMVFGACKLSPFDRNGDKLDTGIRICTWFSGLELLRLSLYLIGILAKFFLPNFQNMMAAEAIGLIFRVPVLLGWFFAGEFKKELQGHKEELANCNFSMTLYPEQMGQGQGLYNPSSSNPYPIVGNPGASGGTEIDFNAQNRHQNQEFRDTMIMCAPSIAYTCHNMMR